jgi:hypothetical protein
MYYMPVNLMSWNKLFGSVQPLNKYVGYIKITSRWQGHQLCALL